MIFLYLLFQVHDLLARDKTVLSLPPDLSSTELRSLYRPVPDKINEPEIEASIRAGDRMFQWLKLINQKRDIGDQIRLSSKGNVANYPIERPLKYGPNSIKKEYFQLIKILPLKMKEKLFGNIPLDSKLPFYEPLFVHYCLQLDGLYQRSLRWKLLSPYLDELEYRKIRDVRGYVYLKKLKDSQLLQFNQLSVEKQNKVKQSLLGLCYNGGTLWKNCQLSVGQLQKGEEFLAFKNKYWGAGEQIWQSFFNIQKPRHDIVWFDGEQEELEIPFQNIGPLKIKKWFQENVEDEFHFKNWQLKIKFGEDPSILSHLVFKKNTTAHVREGNMIVMDKNIDLEEDSMKWIIRHEFAHILRFPDCYLEFYDPESKLMISYQLDVDDLLCSRTGKMNQRIYRELKRVYQIDSFVGTTR